MQSIDSNRPAIEAIKSADMLPGWERELRDEHKTQKLSTWIFRKLVPIRCGFRSLLFLLLVLLALPPASADLKLNCQAPLEWDICQAGTITIYANNSGIEANRISLNLTLPEGFAYNQGSARITPPSGSPSIAEPIIFGRYLNWTNTAWSLKDGQSLRIQFDLTPQCSAPSGRRITVNGKSSSGTAPASYSPSILINRAILKITKEPNVIEASKGDLVTWSVMITNQGTGSARSVQVIDHPSSGLQLLQTDSPGGLLDWSYDKIAPGETKTVNLSFRVAGCYNLVNLVNVSWGCGSACCQESYAKGSIKLVPKEPDIDYTVVPSSIVVPYCGKAPVNVTLTNSGAGNASGIHLHLLNYSAPYLISDVRGAVYFEGNHTFWLGMNASGATLPPRANRSFSFNLSMPAGGCNATGYSDLLDLRIDYFDECGNKWYPPVSLISCSTDTESVPAVTARKSGTESLYLGESGEYTLEVEYSAGSCSIKSIPNSTIVDSYPESFEVVNAAGGEVDGGSHRIIWKDVPLNDTLPWSRTIQLKAADNASCLCGGTYLNELSVNASLDCCHCPLYASNSFPVTVECFNHTALKSSDKTATPSRQESCRLINYTNTYIFNQTSGLGWGDISFNETAFNGQTFPDGMMRGNATFSINGLCTIEQPIYLGMNNNLSFLDDACLPLVEGDVLRISYDLLQHQPGSFVDWSSLCVKGYNSGCGRVQCFQEGVPVAADRADWSIQVQAAPETLSPCQSFDLTINLAKNSPNEDPKWIAHDLNISYNDKNYRYIGPCRITGIVNQSGLVQSFEPGRHGDSLTWELGEKVSRGGNITFRVEKRCSGELTASAALNYADNCRELVTRRAEESPHSITRGDLIILKTPEIVYTLDKNASWKIYVTNRGSGTAYNVTVVDLLDRDLNYTGSKIRKCSSCSFREDPANTTVIDSDLCGPDRIIWRIGDLAPKQQVTIMINATLCGCENRDNRAYATIGCGGDECQNISASSRVELVPSQLLVARHDAGKVDDCGGITPVVLEVRTAGAYVYNLTVIEQLPAGLRLNGTPFVSGAAPSSSDFSTPGRLIWWFNQSQGIRPGTRISIRLNASVTGPCAFKGGSSRVSLSYIEPCGRAGPEVANEIPVESYQPSLSITKKPSLVYASLGGVVPWTITLSSTGDSPARNVTLTDVLPVNTVLHSAYPPVDRGTGSSSNPLLWRMADIPAGGTRVVRLNATVRSCAPQSTDRASVSWSCCPSAPAVATANLVTRPTITSTLNVGTNGKIDSCGGDAIITLRNTGAIASASNLTYTVPLGFVYQKGSARITSSNASHGSSLLQPEPEDYSALNGTLIWRAAALDRIYNSETVTIRLKLLACNGCCNSSAPSPSTLRFYYLDSCLAPYQATRSLIVTPLQASLVVRMEPAVQFQSNVSWKISIDNLGTKPAENVSVLDVLGDGFMDINSANGTLIRDHPSPNWTSIIWPGQRVPVGRDAWSVTISARSDETCGLAHTSNVTITGHCPSGCVYSNHSSRARALSPAAFELASLETLLRSQADLVAGFEGLLKNSTLDSNASVQFINSFDDLSERQQMGLEGFDSLTRCNWKDLEEEERINYTRSFADLLSRQAEIISGHDLLLQRSYCQLDGSQKTILLSRLEDRLHKEQDLLRQFRIWVESQGSLDSGQREVWYQFLASFEDLLRREARLIARFQQMLHSSCEGSFFTVFEKANSTDIFSGSPVNHTILLSNMGERTVRNITINNSILGVVQGLPGIELLPGENRSISRSVSHNCSYCSGCTCRICDFALACGDVYTDGVNKTHVCIVGNEVCINVSQPGSGPVHPG